MTDDASFHGYLPPSAGQPPPLAPEASGASELPARGDGADLRWPGWLAPVGLLFVVAGLLIGSVIVAVPAALAGYDVEKLPPGFVIALTYVQDIVLIAGALIAARLIARPRSAHFGLRRTPLWRALGWTMAAFVAFYAVLAAWASFFEIDERDNLVNELGADKGTLPLIAVAVLVTIAAPIAEELFFRGFFFTALRNWAGLWAAAAMTGLLFGGVHYGSTPTPLLVPLAFFGFVLCLLYARTRSLFPCITLHAFNNSLALGVALHWDWQIPLVLIGSLLVIAALMTPFARWAERDELPPGTAAP